MKIKAIITVALFLKFFCLFMPNAFSHEGETHEDTKGSLRGMYNEGSDSSYTQGYEINRGKTGEVLEEGSRNMNEMQNIPARTKEGYGEIKENGEAVLNRNNKSMGHYYEEGSKSYRVPTN